VLLHDAARAGRLHAPRRFAALPAILELALHERAYRAVTIRRGFRAELGAQPGASSPDAPEHEAAAG